MYRYLHLVSILGIYHVISEVELASFFEQGTNRSKTPTLPPYTTGRVDNVDVLAVVNNVDGAPRSYNTMRDTRQSIRILL